MMHVSIIRPFPFASDYRIAERECFDCSRTMKAGPDIGHIAALIGDPARQYVDCFDEWKGFDGQ